LIDKLNPELQHRFSDIYAWTIDFFGLQKGDDLKSFMKKNILEIILWGIAEFMGAEFDPFRE